MITTVSKLGTRSRRWNTLSSVSYEAWMQAQQSVLGSVLIDDRCASFLVFGLAEEDFCESYRSLYRAIRELYTTGKPVDPVAVLNVVGDSYKDFIVQLMNITPTAANCKMYVDIVKQQSRVLKLRDTGLALSRISTEKEGAELLANAASETVRDDGDVWSLAQGFSDWMHRYQKKPDYVMPSQVDQYPQLCMDVETPFDAEQK